jgi:hypothetical protein
MWDWLVLAAVIVGALAFWGAVVFLGVRILRALRDYRRLRRHVARELDRLADSVERVAASAERAGDTSRLDARMGGLRSTMGRAAVLRAALDEVSDAVGRVTALVPSK